MRFLDCWSVNKMWQYPAAWREGGPCCQTLKFSLRLTDAKTKKERNYNVMLFAGRPLERGMGFVDDAEQICSVRILSYIMHETLNFTRVWGSFVLHRTHGPCISSLLFYIVSSSITLFLITTYTIRSKIHKSVTDPITQISLGYQIDKNEMGGVCSR
jgi:hypothetical protein